MVVRKARFKADSKFARRCFDCLYIENEQLFFSVARLIPFSLKLAIPIDTRRYAVYRDWHGQKLMLKYSYLRRS
jgi:hypothetical protein